MSARWNKPGVPHKGWTWQGCVDLGDLIGECFMCGTHYRYEHTMSHPAYPDVIHVGYKCAADLAEEYAATMKARERALKAEARKAKAEAKRAAEAAEAEEKRRAREKADLAPPNIVFVSIDYSRDYLADPLKENERFLPRGWKQSAKGNPVLRRYGYEVTVFSMPEGFKYCVRTPSGKTTFCIDVFASVPAAIAEIEKHIEDTPRARIARGR